MNYKKNLILLLSLVNIALVIILLVNKKINIELFSQREVCTDLPTENYNTPSDTCSGPDDQTTSATNVMVFPQYFILYFVVDDPETCANAKAINDIYDSYFADESQFYCIHTIKSNAYDFISFHIYNKFKLCGNNNNSSPCIYIRYPFKREFLKLPGNGYYAIEYGKPNTKLSILSVHDYPSAEQFCKKVKKSQDPLYNNGDCNSFNNDIYEHPFQIRVSLNIRTFTSCDDTQPCELD